MSPSPDLSPKSSNAPLPEQSSLGAEESTNPKSEAAKPVNENSSDLNADSNESSPVLRKPPMRPVRPQAPAAAPTKPKESMVGISKQAASKPEVVAATVSTVSASDAVAESQIDPAALRQQPIPPPSEPKQYRAIGIVHGLYTPEEEEFTRGIVKTDDGTELKSVLLGRVMSLVKNHIDLQKEHLWVVYPRTREGEKELHLQIVGVWEPETLKREELDDAEVKSAEEAIQSGFADPRLKDGYFSIRGEVVFLSEEDKTVVVKIQQTPRKSTQKAKAFKLNLQGELSAARTVGYFWDLHVQRQDNALVIAEANCIGLAPPKKRTPGMDDNKGRPRRPFGQRPPRGASGGSRPSVPRPVGQREAISKPIKRSEQSSTDS